jgi:hypothetical protein
VAHSPEEHPCYGDGLESTPIPRPGEARMVEHKVEHKVCHTAGHMALAGIPAADGIECIPSWQRACGRGVCEREERREL